MFLDMGPLEMIALVVIAVLVFGPDKLPKVIADAARFVRKIREFSDTAKSDIRKELGPEFQDFDFQDLNPRSFVRKNLMGNDELGLQEIKEAFDPQDLGIDEIREGFRPDGGTATASAESTEPAAAPAQVKQSLVKQSPRLAADEPAPFDDDAT